MLFRSKARDVGARVELYLADGQRHGFFNREPWTGRTTKRADEYLVSIGYLTRSPVGQPEKR